MKFTSFKRMAFGYALIMLVVVYMGISATLKVNLLTDINYRVAKVDGAMINMGEELFESLFSQAGFNMKYLVSLSLQKSKRIALQKKLRLLFASH